MKRYRLTNNGIALPHQSTPDWARVQAAMAAPAMTPAEALRCAPGATVKVRGAIQPGPSGPVTAPISGQQTAWYRSYVQPGNWVLTPLPPAARFADIMLVAQPSHLLWRRFDATDEISEAAFRVVGPDGSALLVDPRVADVNSDHVARNRVESSRLGFQRQLLVEFVLPVGTEVVLLADVGAGGQPATGRDAFVFVSTRPDADIVQRAAHGLAEHDSAQAIFRFVSGGQRFVRGFRQVALIVGAVVVVVLVVLLAIALS